MRLLRALSGIVWTVACTSAPAQTPPTPTRGQLLYTTHCIACHDQRMHWRDQRHATDWESLKQQVRQWQGSVGLNWGDADIAEVARYLNDTIYKFSQTSDRKG